MKPNNNLTSHSDSGDRTKAVSAMQIPSPNQISHKLPKLFKSKRTEQESSSERTKAFSTMYSLPDDLPFEYRQRDESLQNSKADSSENAASDITKHEEKTRALDLSKFTLPSQAHPSSPDNAAVQSQFPLPSRNPNDPALETDKTAAIKVPENLKAPKESSPPIKTSEQSHSINDTVSNNSIITLSNQDVDLEGLLNNELDLDISKTAAIPVPHQNHEESFSNSNTNESNEVCATVALPPMELDSKANPSDVPTNSNNEPLAPSDFNTLHFMEKEENCWQNAQQYELPSIGDTVGNYTIIEEMGRGSFGAVYKARNIILGRDEALKLILPSAKMELEDIEKRFEREINIVSRLEHPNIVRLYSSGKLPQGILWMTMELIQGERVDNHLISKGPFKFADAQNFMLQLLSGLREAHKHQIIHRDLKPANIMIQQKEGYPNQVVILDFGLSKSFSPDNNNELQNLTQMSSKKVFGTPQYMAPEQLRMGSIGPWTDVYAAGLIYYELIVGKRAIDAQTLVDVAYKQYYEKIKLPQYLHNTAIEAIIQKACAKDPSQRYQSALEFFNAVKQIGDIYSPPPENSNASGQNFAEGKGNAPNDARSKLNNNEAVIYAASHNMDRLNKGERLAAASQPYTANSINTDDPSTRSHSKFIIMILLITIVVLAIVLVVLLFLDVKS